MKYHTLTPITAVVALNLAHAEEPIPSSPRHELEEMVVTGSNVREPLKEAPVRTEIIDRELIIRSASRDLAEAVEYSPGLRVETTCGNCNQQQIQMLGLPQSYISILADGLPTFSSLAGVYGIEQIPAGLIGNIEVVKGGGSALYGSGAVAGVINLIPRDPQKTGGEIDLRLSAMDGSGVTGKLPLDLFALHDWVLTEQHLKLTAFANYGYIQPQDYNRDGFTDVSERRLLSGGLRAVWEPAPETSVAFDYFISDEERRGGETGSAFRNSPNLAVITEELHSKRQVASLKWKQELTSGLEHQLSYAWSRTRRNSYYGGTVALGSPDPLSPFFDPDWDDDKGFGHTASDLHFFDSLLTWTLSDAHRLTFGLQYRNEHLTDTQKSVGRTLDDTYENFGTILQHRWKPNDLLTFEYGARLDIHTEVEDPILSPRATLMVEPSSNFRIRNSLAWGFRAPETFDEDLHIANVGGDLQIIEKDPSLKEETAITFSVAPEWQINDRWRLETNFFHTWLDNSFVVSPNDDPATPDVQEFIKTNGGKSSIYGAEINLGYFADNWRVELSWTEQRLEYDERQLLLGDDTFADPADNPVFSSRYTRTPRHLGLLKFAHEGAWFDTFVACKLTGPMQVPHVVTGTGGNLTGNRLKRTPWFYNVDIGFSKGFEIFGDDTLTLSLGCRNVLGEFQRDIDKGAYRDADYVYGPAFPRTFYAGAKWEF